MQTGAAAFLAPSICKKAKDLLRDVQQLGRQQGPIRGDVEMSKAPFDFWQDHSVTYLEMAFKPDRMEPLAAPDGVGHHTGECGDTVAMFLKLHGDTITQVAFQVQGCMNTIASANAVAELIEGKPLDAAWVLSPVGQSLSPHLRLLLRELAAR